MIVEISGLRDKLKLIGQEHILDFWEELDNREKIALSSQIESIDLEQINKLYENSKIDEDFDMSIVSPMKYIDSMKLANKEKYTKICERAIRNGEIAVVSMAGGQRNKAWIPWP